MRVATIDIGTNTVLLLVAERRHDGELVALEERATITRLGEGVDATRRFKETAVARTKACLDDYAAVVSGLGVSLVDVVGTSAMRDAEGGEVIVEHARGRFGVPARVLSGAEEALATFRGALSGLPACGGPVTVYDIGGGSTEVVVGVSGRAPTYARSFDVGSVRLTERHLKGDPPADLELAAAREEAARILAPVALERADLARGGVPVGIAGTVTTLAAMARGIVPYDGARVHGSSLARGELSALVDRLASMPLARRRGVPGLDPGRADVIVAGGIVVLSVLDALGADGTRVSDRGVRWGLAAALAGIAD